MRDARTRNLKEMLPEAQNISKLMAGPSRTALFCGSKGFSEEAMRLERRPNDLVFDMRSLAISAATSRADAEQRAAYCR